MPTVPTSTRVRGTDLSKFQLDPDFAALTRDESLVFGLIKSTEGTGYRDPEWERNLSSAPPAFEYAGCYHILRGTSDGASQADSAAREWTRLAKRCAEVRTKVLPLGLDFEIADAREPAWLVDNAIRFRARIEQLTGLKPLVYSYPNFLRVQCGDAAPVELAECPQWLAFYAGKKWSDMAAGFDPVVELRRRGILPRLWDRAGWAIYQYDGDKGEFYRGTDYDFNVAVSRDVLDAMCDENRAPTLPAPLDSTDPTSPGTPTSKSYERLHAVREPIADLSSTSPATPLRAGEGEHTPAHLKAEDDL